MKRIIFVFSWLLSFALATEASQFEFSEQICQVRLPLSLTGGAIECTGVLLTPSGLVLPGHCVRQAMAAEDLSPVNEDVGAHFDADVQCLPNIQEQPKRVHVKAIRSQLPVNDSLDVAVVRLEKPFSLNKTHLGVADSPQHAIALAKDAVALFTPILTLVDRQLFIEQIKVQWRKSKNPEIDVDRKTMLTLKSTPLIAHARDGGFWFLGFAHPAPELTRFQQMANSVRGWRNSTDPYPFQVDLVTKATIFETSRFEQIIDQRTHNLTLPQQCSRLFLPRGQTRTSR